jgi:glycosyltransferase involved in cell wall biosynthesis
MLVSATVDSQLRSDVTAGRRPMPEYLSLESRFGVELVDWSKLGVHSGHRSVRRSLRHVAVSLRRARQVDVIFSDGEHVGIPLALAMQALRIDTPHVMIGHNLLTPAKQRVLRHLPLRGLDRVLVHSMNQVGSIVSGAAGLADRLAVVPYGIDASFWSRPHDGAEEGLVVSAGREHRDYQTLVAALPLGARLTIADHSPYTPHATRRDPDVWPSTVDRVALDAVGLRALYDRAAIVVVPVVESLMPAGITTLLEAMSMGKAVVVTETSELRGVIQHGESGLVVRPGDVSGMHAAIERLLASPSARRALGSRARQVALERYDVNVYSSALAGQLSEAASLRQGSARHRSDANADPGELPSGAESSDPARLA